MDAAERVHGIQLVQGACASADKVTDVPVGSVNGIQGLPALVQEVVNQDGVILRRVVNGDCDVITVIVVNGYGVLRVILVNRLMSGLIGSDSGIDAPRRLYKSSKVMA
jgi:hypothetical protein